MNLKWTQLWEEVHSCRFKSCHRNSEKLPILFNREPESLLQVKAVLVSQEPSHLLLEKSVLSKEIEESLRRACQTGGGKLPRKMVEILGRTFDHVTDDVYWTHTLKCIPRRNNNQIHNEWVGCASQCIDHFKRELALIPVKELAVVTFGKYALTMCQHIFEDKPLTKIEKITQHFVSHDPDQEFIFAKKHIQLFPFIHPRYEEAHLNRLGKKGKQKRQKLKQKLQDFIQMK